MNSAPASTVPGVHAPAVLRHRLHQDIQALSTGTLFVAWAW